MVQIAGTFQCVETENLEEYLRETGLPEEFIQRVMEPDSTVEVFEEGNKFTFNNSSGSMTTFVLDEEYEELARKGVISVATREGDTFTITSRTPDGQTGVRCYEFTDDGVTAVLTFNDVTATRHYKRII